MSWKCSLLHTQTVKDLSDRASGTEHPQDAGLWSDDHITPLKRVIDVIHSQSQKAAIQLQHAGRKGSICPPWLGFSLVPDEFGGYAKDVQSPTAEPWNENYATPTEMTEEEITETIEAYGQAAGRAVKAGVDVIAIHGAHGYLIHSFASPAVSTGPGTSLQSSKDSMADCRKLI